MSRIYVLIYIEICMERYVYERYMERYVYEYIYIYERYVCIWRDMYMSRIYVLIYIEICIWRDMYIYIYERFVCIGEICMYMSTHIHSTHIHISTHIHMRDMYVDERYVYEYSYISLLSYILLCTCPLHSYTSLICI